MGGFIFRKLGAALIVVFLASVLVFVGVRAIPGDPALAYAAEERDPAALAGDPGRSTGSTSRCPSST